MGDKDNIPRQQDELLNVGGRSCESVDGLSVWYGNPDSHDFSFLCTVAKADLDVNVLIQVVVDLYRGVVCTKMIQFTYWRKKSNRYKNLQLLC